MPLHPTSSRMTCACAAVAEKKEYNEKAVMPGPQGPEAPQMSPNFAPAKASADPATATAAAAAAAAAPAAAGTANALAPAAAGSAGAAVKKGAEVLKGLNLSADPTAALNQLRAKEGELQRELADTSARDVNVVLADIAALEAQKKRLKAAMK